MGEEQISLEDVRREIGARRAEPDHDGAERCGQRSVRNRPWASSGCVKEERERDVLVLPSRR